MEFFAIFATIVLPVGGGLLLGFIAMQNKHKERMALNANPEVGEAEIEGLSRIADILDQRVRVLESILDDEVPDWRENLDRRTADEVLG